MFTLVLPVTVDAVALADTNVAEAEAAWSGVTTYASGNVVRRTVGNVHRRYSSLQNTNLNRVPEFEPDWWLDEGPTNRWAMFDDTTTTVTTNADLIEVEIQVPDGQRADTVYLAALDGRTARIQVVDPIAGLVHDETYSLQDVGAVTDLWTYFKLPILRKAELLVTDLPDGAGSTITVTIEKPGATAGCGHLVLGQQMTLGKTKWGVQTSVRDYTRPLENDFGDREFIEGPYRKLANCELIIPNTLKDAVEHQLIEIRGKPRLFIADDRFTTLAVFGVATWTVGMDMPPDYSTGSLQIEGNT